MWNMPPILAERLWCLRARLAEALLESNSQAVKLLHQEYRLDEAPATSLINWLERQMSVSEIPDQGLLIEATASPDGEHVFYALHLPLPAAASEGLARVLSWRLRPGGTQFPIEPGPLGFLITLPAEMELDPESWRPLLSPDDFGIDLLRVISTGPVLGRKFMEAAHTGMMLLRTPLRCSRFPTIATSPEGSGRRLLPGCSHRSLPHPVASQRDSATMDSRTFAPGL
jgi:Lhr-like helicase